MMGSKPKARSNKHTANELDDSPSETRIKDIITVIRGGSFAEWYREREFAENIREGKPYFNGPDRVPPPERHSPSQLNQCYRKIYYRQLNAPEEQTDLLC